MNINNIQQAKELITKSEDLLNNIDQCDKVSNNWSCIKINVIQEGQRVNLEIKRSPYTEDLIEYIQNRLNCEYIQVTEQLSTL